MENQRLLLYLALGFLGLVLWQSWVQDYAPPEPVAGTALDSGQGIDPASGPGVDAAPAALPPASPGDDLPGLPGAPASTAPTPTAPVAVAGGAADAAAATPVHVRTDVIDVAIDPVGATITGVNLLNYAVSVERPDEPFTLMSDDPAHFLVAQSGLQSSAGVPAPTHLEPMRTEASDYRLADGQDTIDVPFTWEEGGVRVTKTLTFTRDSYQVQVAYRVENGSGAPYTVNQYRQLKRKPGTKDERQQFVNTYIGGVVSTTDDVYQKVKFADMEKANLDLPATGGWVAMIQHYFAAAWIPPEGEVETAYTRFLPGEDRYLIGMVSPPVTMAPGAVQDFASRAYIGPKVQDRLAAAAPNLDLTVDYGYVTIIARPLFWLLKSIHNLIGNWGFAIIILTFLIKAAFYKLSEASYRSMARMKKLQPKLASLKERHGDDRAAMGQATMELYKKEKVNPLGGCLPMIIQIPVFISLYWTLLESIELRQAPWILWIQDLSIRDPYYVLPVVMVVTMLLQQRLNPAPVDPIQAKVFQFLPLMFGVFFAFFPAGLVLYYIVNNTLSISQQYYITRHVLAEKGGSGPQGNRGGKGGLSLSKGPTGGGPGGGGLRERLGGLFGGTAKAVGGAGASTHVGAGMGSTDGATASKGDAASTDARDDLAAVAAAARMDAPDTLAALMDGDGADGTRAGGTGTAPSHIRVDGPIDGPAAGTPDDGASQPGGTPKPHKRGKPRRKRKTA